MRSYVIPKARKFSFVVYDYEKFPYVNEFLLHFLEPKVMVISPLHPADEYCKAGHYHFYLQYDGLIPVERVQRIVDMLCSSCVNPVKNTMAVIRYFCHYDNPDKVQLDPSELYVYGDLDVKQFF